jgi:hypothetical protein
VELEKLFANILPTKAAPKDPTILFLLDKALLEIPESAPSRLPAIADFNAVGKPTD